MLIEITPNDYSKTEEEYRQFAERFDAGEVDFYPVSGECDVDEADEFYLQEKARIEASNKEVEEIESGIDIIAMKVPQNMYEPIAQYARQYQISENRVIVRMLRGDIPLPTV